MSEKSVEMQTTKRIEKQTKNTVDLVSSQDTETGMQPPKPENEVFVDGVFNAGLRAGVAKIDFYQAIGFMDKEKEVRKVSQRIIMPIAAIYELQDLITQIVTKIKENAEAKETEESMALTE